MSAHRLEIVLELDGPKVPISKVRELVEDHLGRMMEELGEVRGKFDASLNGQWRGDRKLHDRRRAPWKGARR